MNQILHSSEFWRRVSASPHRFLALDYDGTLAPFQVDPMHAYPLNGVSQALEAFVVSGHTSVAIISGRPVQEIVTLLGVSDLTVIGCHGYEILDPHSGLTVRSPDPRQVDGLERAVEIARLYEYANNLEVKIGSIAFHTRGMPEQLAFKAQDRMSREWSRLCVYGLSCRRFNGGVEVTSNGWNKGDSLRALLQTQPRDTLPVYVGDDATDEDAFQVVRVSGFGIKVGAESVPTLATIFLPDCRGVLAFLESWLALFDVES